MGFYLKKILIFSFYLETYSWEGKNNKKYIILWYYFILHFNACNESINLIYWNKHLSGTYAPTQNAPNRKGKRNGIYVGQLASNWKLDRPKTHTECGVNSNGGKLKIGSLIQSTSPTYIFCPLDTNNKCSNNWHCGLSPCVWDE